MARPLKWSRDLHPIRERASRSRTETWSRRDVEDLFSVGRATAQTLMKAVGEVQNVAGAHFVERTSLLSFLDEMIGAESIDAAFRVRLQTAEAPPVSKPLRVSLPADLRSITFRDLPSQISVTPGQLVIQAESAAGIIEGLALLAQALQNDLATFERIAAPLPAKRPQVDEELQALFASIRKRS